MAKTDYRKKIALLGNGGVGKTSLIRRFVNDEFSDSYQQTLGVKVESKRMKVGNSYVAFSIWDVVGQPGQHASQTFAAKAAQGAIFVADITSRESLDALEYWTHLAESENVRNYVFLANKTDKPLEEHQFTYGEFRQLAARYDSPSYLTSAKTGENVEHAFRELGRRVMSKDLLNTAKSVKSSLISPIEERLQTLTQKGVIVTTSDVLDIAQSYSSVVLASIYGEKGVNVAHDVLHKVNSKIGLDARNPEPEKLELFVGELRGELESILQKEKSNDASKILEEFDAVCTNLAGIAILRAI